MEALAHQAGKSAHGHSDARLDDWLAAVVSLGPDGTCYALAKRCSFVKRTLEGLKSRKVCRSQGG